MNEMLMIFPIVNFPILSGNIPALSSYGVFTGEAVRYVTACTHFDDFNVNVSYKKLNKTVLYI